MHLIPPSLLAIGAVLALSFTSSAFAAATGTIIVEGRIDDNVTCDLRAGDVNRTIKLDLYPVGNVPASNQSFGYQSFTLTADCSTNATTVSFLFSGTPSVGDGARFQNTGDATGLGLQLESAADGKLIPANGIDGDRTRTLNVVNGTAALNLRAAYYREAPVKAGSFESKVMVSLSYN